MKHYILCSDGHTQSYFFKYEKKFRLEHERVGRKKVHGKYHRVWKRKVPRFPPPPRKRRFYYCFVKGFNTGAGRSRQWHWVETSVDVWCEFVVEVPEGEAIEVWEQKNLPSDKVMIGKIEDWLEEQGEPLSNILKMHQVKHVWGVEREEKPNEVVTWPEGNIIVYRMPGYDKIMDKGKVELA